MRLRATHLACIILLLSSLGAGSSTTRETFSLNSPRIRALLQQTAPSAVTPIAPARSLADITLTGPIASPAPLRAAWSMRPPAAHSAHTHAVTASAV